MADAPITMTTEDFDALLATPAETSIRSSSTAATADSKAVAYLATPLFATAVTQAHDKVGDGEYVRINRLLPLSIIGRQDSQKHLRYKLAVALNSTREQRQEKSDKDKAGEVKWLVRTTAPAPGDDGYEAAQEAGTLDQYGCLEMRATVREQDK
jgi:hypothetical protein